MSTQITQREVFITGSDDRNEDSFCLEVEDGELNYLCVGKDVNNREEGEKVEQNLFNPNSDNTLKEVLSRE